MEMWKRNLIINGAIGLIAASCLVAQAQVPGQGAKDVVGTWIREAEQARPDGDRMVFRDDRTLVMTERGERLPGTWKPLEGSRLQLAVSAERNKERVLEWKVLNGGVLRLWDAKHRKDGPTFWVRQTAWSRQAARKPASPRPIWELPQYKDGRPVCSRCDQSDFGRPKDWRKHSQDGRTITCGVCGTPYRFLLSNGTVYQPTRLAKAPRKGKYSAFRKLVAREGTWRLQSERGANTISFNASRGTAFISGQKWLWEEVAKDHVQVTCEGDKLPRDWKWEMSDDRQMVLVTESIPAGNQVKLRKLSLISLR
jgi:hypothetical protein